MKKKAIALLTAAAMTISVLAGCGSSSGTTQATGAASGETASGAAESSAAAAADGNFNETGYPIVN